MESTIACASRGARNRIPADKRHLSPKCGRCGSSMRKIGEVVALTDQNFAVLAEGSVLPILVDFYSPTCGPCKMLAPVIENLAQRYGDRAVIAKLDTSRNHLVPGRFGIRGVPTLIFFQRGQPVEQLVGAQPQQVIEDRLRQLLAAGH